MNIWDLQERYPKHEDREKVIAKMSLEEVKELISSCGTPQGKTAIKKQWERLTGERYS